MVYPSVKSSGSFSTVEGQVIFADQFGNLISNVGESLLPKRKRGCTVRLGHHSFQGIWDTFSDVPAGRPLALIGSHKRLEVAINQDNASLKLGCQAGDRISVEWNDAMEPEDLEPENES